MSFLNKKLAILPLVVLGSLAQAQINMGMTGDSLTDDYLGGAAKVNSDLAAFSWGQVLAETRSSDFNFGGYKSVDDGTWDSVRYSGYEYNYATAGGAASDNTTMNISNFLTLQVDNVQVGSSYLSTQTTALAQEISAGNVDTAFVGIGSNDFFYHTNVFDFDGNWTADPTAVIDQAYIDDIANSILAGVDTLLAADSADVLLALIPAGTAGGSNPEILDGINAVNTLLLQGAADRGIATVDLFGYNSDPDRVNEDGAITIGDLIIELDTAASAADISAEGTGPCNSLGCATESHANYYLADDGLHPNTIVQALIANQIIDALNSHYGHSIALLSDEEILAVAGISAVPVPAAAWLFGSALLGLIGVKRRSANRH